MLQVAVDHGHVGRRAGQRPLDHGAGQAPPTHAADTAQARVMGRQGLDRIRRSVRRIIVDEHRLPGDSLERDVQLGHQALDIGPLVEGRHHHRQLGAGGVRLRRRRGDGRLNCDDSRRRLGPAFGQFHQSGLPARPRAESSRAWLARPADQVAWTSRARSPPGGLGMQRLEQFQTALIVASCAVRLNTT